MAGAVGSNRVSACGASVHDREYTHTRTHLSYIHRTIICINRTDEAHLARDWGETFRPAMAELSAIVKNIGARYTYGSDVDLIWLGELSHT